MHSVQSILQARTNSNIFTHHHVPARLLRSASVRHLVRAAERQEQVPDASYDLVGRYQGVARGLPLWAGGAGVLGLLANRTLSGIAPVVDASSSQSRADVLGILLSAVLLLTGLQWLALKAKPLASVELTGTEVNFVDTQSKIPPKAVKELEWAWTSLRATSRCRSMVVIYQGRNIFHAGAANAAARPGQAAAGEVCNKAMQSGKGNYLANLVLYPGRDEFVRYLPDNCQGVVVQPVGKNGVLVIGTDTPRGISRLDQAWIATIADKLEVALEGFQVPGTGFGGSSAAGNSATLSKVAPTRT